MDEALKRAAEQIGIVDVDSLELAKAKAWLTAFERAMESEQVPEHTRRRVVNCLVWGHPDGDTLKAREEMARWDMARDVLQAQLPKVDSEHWQQIHEGRLTHHTEESDRG